MSFLGTRQNSFFLRALPRASTHAPRVSMSVEPAVADADVQVSASVIDQAFTLSQLDRFDMGADAVLGQCDWDMFVMAMLANAGISVELVKLAPGHGEEPRHISVQIVDTVELEDRLKEKDIDNVRFSGPDNMRGVQVKLNGAHTWQIDIADENKQQHGVMGSRNSSRQKATSTTIRNHTVFEVAVGVPDSILTWPVVTTPAFATTVVINIGFEVDESSCSIFENGLPHVAQRRVDVLFHNCIVVTAQVSSIPIPFRVARLEQKHVELGTLTARCVNRVPILLPQTVFMDLGDLFYDATAGVKYIDQFAAYGQQTRLSASELSTMSSITSAKLNLYSMTALHPTWTKQYLTARDHVVAGDFQGGSLRQRTVLHSDVLIYRVHRSDAGYLNAAVNQNGEVDNLPEDLIPFFTYSSWERQCRVSQYAFDHEPLFTTFEDADNEILEFNETPIDADAQKWKLCTLPPIDSVSIFLHHKGMLVLKVAKSRAIKDFEPASNTSNKIGDNADTTYKGRWNGVSKSLKSEKGWKFSVLDKFATNLKEYVPLVDTKKIDLTTQGVLSFAPFAKLVEQLVDAGKNGAPQITQLMGPAFDLKEWTDAQSKLRPKKKRSTKTGAPHTASKRPRSNKKAKNAGLVDDASDDNVDESEDDEDDDNDDRLVVDRAAVEQENLKKSTPLQSEHTLSISGKATKLSSSLWTELDQRFDNRYCSASQAVSFDQNINRLTTTLGETKSRLDLLVSDADDDSKQAHIRKVQQLFSVISSLGTVLSCTNTALKNNGTPGTSPEVMVNMLKALNDGIINMVQNVFEWPEPELRKLYTALVGVEEFQTALNKLKTAPEPA